MRELEAPADLDALVGHDLGTSDWLTVTQDRINAFADATGDHQWIHTDPGRAARELPGGTTIAHGYLTLSLIPALAATIYTVRRRTTGINYGSDKVRFTAPVPAGSRVRLHLHLIASVPTGTGRRLTQRATVEIEGGPRPALVAEVIVVLNG